MVEIKSRPTSADPDTARELASTLPRWYTWLVRRRFERHGRPHEAHVIPPQSWNPLRRIEWRLAEATEQAVFSRKDHLTVAEQARHYRRYRRRHWRILVTQMVAGYPPVAVPIGTESLIWWRATPWTRLWGCLLRWAGPPFRHPAGWRHRLSVMCSRLTPVPAIPDLVDLAGDPWYQDPKVTLQSTVAPDGTDLLSYIYRHGALGLTAIAAVKATRGQCMASQLIYAMQFYLTVAMRIPVWVTMLDTLPGGAFGIIQAKFNGLFRDYGLPVEPGVYFANWDPNSGLPVPNLTGAYWCDVYSWLDSLGVAPADTSRQAFKKRKIYKILTGPDNEAILANYRMPRRIKRRFRNPFPHE
jgi:hypothetical protein